MQVEAASLVISEDLSVKKVEAFVKEMKVSGLIPADRRKGPRKPQPVAQENPPPVEESTQATSTTIELPHENYVRLVEGRLAEMLGTQVKIIADAQTNQIQINFADDTQLLKLVRNLDRNMPGATKQITTKEEKIAALRKFSTEGIVF